MQSTVDAMQWADWLSQMNLLVGVSLSRPWRGESLLIIMRYCSSSHYQVQITTTLAFNLAVHLRKSRVQIVCVCAVLNVQLLPDLRNRGTGDWILIILFGWLWLVAGADLL